jgi:hypothetical protein
MHGETVKFGRLYEFWGCSVVAEDSVLVVYDAASLGKFMQRRMSEQRNSQIWARWKCCVIYKIGVYSGP